MTRCAGTQDWRGGIRGSTTGRATLRSHSLLHGRRGGSTPPEPNPRPSDEETATD